jgi:3-phosphoshikimate 1-carboxyvinyltransferase
MILSGPYQTSKHTIHLPFSKSELVRYIIAYCLAGNFEVSERYLINEDAVSAFRVGRHLFSLLNGGDISEINCGESGICLNIATFIAAVFGNEITITGNKTLLNRDISPLLGALSECGIPYESNGINIPIKIGQFTKSVLNLDCSRSTQPLTGLLFAAPFVKNGITIIADNLIDDAGYIDMTLGILESFGISPDYSERGEYKFLNSVDRIPESSLHSTFKNLGFEVATDATHAANFAVIGALTGEVNFAESDSTINIQDKTDDFLARVLTDTGAVTEFKNGRIHRVTNPSTEPRNELKSFETDISSFPDLFPPLAALACCVDGESIIRGISRLKFKESNRAEVIANEFSKTGAVIKIDWANDFVSIQGGMFQASKQLDIMIDSHYDHRIAMAAAILPANTQCRIKILHHDCVAKTYPEYFDEILKFM